MSELVDARGLACPEPVILTKKALDSHGEVTVLDDLKALEEKGTRILLCDTCVNFFELAGKTGAGVVSNMYDIAGALSTAGGIVKP